MNVKPFIAVTRIQGSGIWDCAGPEGVLKDSAADGIGLPVFAARAQLPSAVQTWQTYS